MDPKEWFENMALQKGWESIYARRDFANTIEVVQWLEDELESFQNNETVLVIDPIARSNDPSQSVSAINYSGSIMILTVSDLDDTYEGKWEKFIQPLLGIVHGEMEQALRCVFDVGNWNSIEVINQFDRNADGLSIRYNLKGY